MGLAVSSGSSTSLASADFSGVSVTPTASIGLDTGNVAPSNWQPIWVDIIKQSGGFYTVSNHNDPAPTNADGWPTTDFAIPNLLTSVAGEAGIYSLSMDVSQDPTVSFGGATLSNASYNSSTHVYTASVTIAAGVNVSMTVTNTDGGVTNLQIISPGYSTTDPPIFTTGYISFLQSLHPTVLRFMNWTQTNNNPTITWAQRPMPDDATQTETATLYNYNGTVDTTGTAIGVCWEYAIILANAVHADMWINIPAQANDNYVEQLASLIKNGDTINDVSYPALDPDLNVYVEYSNETWNSGDEGYQYATDAAVAEVVAGAQSGGTPSNLNYDNLSLAQNSDGTYVNASTWQLRWTAPAVADRQRFRQRLRAIGDRHPHSAGPVQHPDSLRRCSAVGVHRRGLWRAVKILLRHRRRHLCQHGRARRHNQHGQRRKQQSQSHRRGRPE